MAQLHFYVPDEIADDLRRRAQADGLSLSKYLAKLVGVTPKRMQFPKDYFEKLDAWNLPDDFEIPEPPPLRENDPDFS